MKNADIKAKLIDPLNKLPGVKAIKIHGNKYVESGTPDVVVSVRGRCVWLEVKRDAADKPERIQEVRMREWRDAGAVVAAVTTLDEARAIVAGIP